MADNIYIPRPFYKSESTIQADAPLMAAHEASMATQNTGLWWQTSDQKTLFWPSPTVTPYVTFSSGTTTDAFIVDSGASADFSVAWLFHSRGDRIHARLYIARQTSTNVRVRIISEKLLAADTTSTTTGPWSDEIATAPVMPTLRGPWHDGMQAGYYRVIQSIACSVDPTIDGGTNRIALRFEADLIGGWPGNASDTINIGLHCIEIWNEKQVGT